MSFLFPSASEQLLMQVTRETSPPPKPRPHNSILLSPRLYKPPPPPPDTGSKLVSKPFAYLLAPSSSPPYGNSLTRASAYASARPGGNRRSVALPPTSSTGNNSKSKFGQTETDYRPPTASFDEYREEFHDRTHPNFPTMNRRAAYAKLQAKERRMRLRLLHGDIDTDEDDSAEEAETTGDKRSLVHSTSPPHSASLIIPPSSEDVMSELDAERARLERKRAEREERKAMELSKAAEIEKKRQAEAQFHLLSSFNTQMSGKSNEATAAPAAPPSLAPQTQTSNPSSELHSSNSTSTVATSFTGSAGPAASPTNATHIAKESAAVAAAVVANSILPVVTPGVPPFHFDPADSINAQNAFGGYARQGAVPGNVSTKASRAEERRREAAFEKEKKQLLAFLRGTEVPQQPTVPTLAIPANISIPPSAGSPLHVLGAIVEEEKQKASPSTTTETNVIGAAPHHQTQRSSRSVSPAKRAVGFSNASKSARHNGSTTIREQATTGSSPPQQPSARSVTIGSSSSRPSHSPGRSAANARSLLHAADARLVASAGSAAKSFFMNNSRTLSLDDKKRLEHQRKAKLLFQQVCGNGMLTTASTTQNSTADLLSAGGLSSRSGRKTRMGDEGKFGFGLDLSVEELSRNIREEQRVISGLTSGSIVYMSEALSPSGDATEEKHSKLASPINLSKSNSRAALKIDPSLKENDKDPKEKEITLSRQTSQSGVASSKGATSASLKDGETHSSGKRSDAGDEKTEKKPTSGEYTEISPELVMALIKATKRGDATMVATLIAQVAEEQRLEFINMRDKNGSTAIFHTVWPGHYHALRVLLQNGADPNIQNVKKNTALHLAVERGHQSLIRCLLEHKADYTLLNYEGKVCYQTPQKEDDRVLMERFIMNCAAEVKRGTHSNFKMDIQALLPAPDVDPFHPQFYKLNTSWQAAETRLKTALASEQLESQTLREIMLAPTPQTIAAALEAEKLQRGRTAPPGARAATAAGTNGKNEQTATADGISPTRGATAPGGPRSRSPSPAKAKGRPNTTAGTGSRSTSPTHNAGANGSEMAQQRPATSPVTNSGGVTGVVPLLIHAPAPHPWFKRFLRRALNRHWDPNLARDAAYQSGVQVAERALHRRWARAQRAATRARRQKEKEDRRAREKALNPQWEEEEAEAAFSSRTGSPSKLAGTESSRLRSPTRSSMESPRAFSPSSRPTTTPYRRQRRKKVGSGDEEEEEDSDFDSSDELSPRTTAEANAYLSLLDRPFSPVSPSNGSVHASPHSPLSLATGTVVSLPNSPTAATTTTLSHYLQSPPSTALALDATYGTPVYDLNQPGFSQPLSARFGLATPSGLEPSSPSRRSVAQLKRLPHSPFVKGPELTSILAPPFRYNTDFGATNAWVTELSQAHDPLSKMASSPPTASAPQQSQPQEWKFDQPHPPAHITPSAFPVGFPYTSCEKQRPMVSPLTAPTVVRRARDLGLIHSNALSSDHNLLIPIASDVNYTIPLDVDLTSGALRHSSPQRSHTARRRSRSNSPSIAATPHPQKQRPPHHQPSRAATAASGGRAAKTPRQEKIGTSLVMNEAYMQRGAELLSLAHTTSQLRAEALQELQASMDSHVSGSTHLLAEQRLSNNGGFVSSQSNWAQASPSSQIAKGMEEEKHANGHSTTGSVEWHTHQYRAQSGSNIGSSPRQTSTKLVYAHPRLHAASPNGARPTTTPQGLRALAATLPLPSPPSTAGGGGGGGGGITSSNSSRGRPRTSSFSAVAGNSSKIPVNASNNRRSAGAEFMSARFRVAASS